MVLTNYHKLTKKFLNRFQIHITLAISHYPQFKFLLMKSTLHSIVNLDLKFTIDFTKENTLRSILGFDSKKIYSGSQLF